MPSSKDESVSGTIHSRLSTHSLKQSEATGGDERYHEGYSDAFEWVLNHVLPNSEGLGHVDDETVPASDRGGGRREYIKMGELFPQIGRGRCRVCMGEVQPPKTVYCSDYCSTIVSNVQQLFSWTFIRQYAAERDGECVKCGSEGSCGIDHIIPHSKGGHPFDPDNLQRLCDDCHNEKGVSQIDYRDDGDGGVQLFPRNTVGQLTMESFDEDVDSVTSNDGRSDGTEGDE